MIKLFKILNKNMQRIMLILMIINNSITSIVIQFQIKFYLYKS